MMEARTWEAIELLTAWFDGDSELPADQRKIARILKMNEEAGEVCAAAVGVLGENPRKNGVTNTWDDVAKELCDVAVTALLALRCVTPDAQRVFAEHVEFVTGRAVEAGAFPPDRDVAQIDADVSTPFTQTDHRVGSSAIATRSNGA